MSSPISPLRLNLLKFVFLGNFLVVGGYVVRGLVGHVGPWDPVRGVAYSFWGALALLSAVGVRVPMKMLPVLLMQFVYKSIWLLAIYLPMRPGEASGLLPMMVVGVLVLAGVIPWSYVLTAYVGGTESVGRVSLDRPNEA